MLKLLESQADAGYAGFTGAKMKGRIPLKQEVINEVLQETVSANNDLIKEIHLTLKEQNQVGVSLTVQKWFLSKSFNLELYLEKQVGFPDSPKIKIWLSSSPRVLINTAEFVAGIFGFLPEGLTITGRLIEVDLSLLLKEQKAAEFFRFIKLVEIEGQTGKMILHFYVEIN